MKYLDYITGIINEAVSDAIPCERKNILGVAHAVRVDDAQRPKIVPGIYENGNVTYGGFDDNYALVSYHKAGSMSSRLLPGTGYGDDTGRILLTHNMSLVLFFNTDVMGMNADQLGLVMQMAVPPQITKDQRPKGWYNSAIGITNIILNHEQVFREEFQNVDYFLGPEHALIKCNYTIESTLNRRCFEPNYQTC